MAVDPRTRTACDWELHFWTGSEWSVLRPVVFPAHRCCVYKVRVETMVRRHERELEPVGAAHGEGATVDHRVRELDLEGAVSAETAVGSPRSARLEHEEVTRISVNLESGCADPQNVYAASGDSSLALRADHSSSKEDAGAEGVEDVAASGWLWGEVFGDLDWIVHESSDIDPAELQPMIQVRREMDPDRRVDIPIRVGVDANTGSRDDGDPIRYEATDIDVGTRTTTGPDWRCWILSDIDVAARSSGVERPVTDDPIGCRVDHKLTHAVRVSGEMARGDCDAVGCCTGNAGHVCRCEPRFELVLDSAGSRLVVDGTEMELSRGEDPSPDEAPSYRAWAVNRRP